MRALAQRMLAENGYTVLAEASAEEAGEIFEKEKGGVRLILSNILLPDLAGRALVERLLASAPHVGVVFTGAYIRDDTGSGNGHPFLQKPYTRQDLLRVTREVLDSHRDGV